MEKNECFKKISVFLKLSMYKEKELYQNNKPKKKRICLKKVKLNKCPLSRYMSIFKTLTDKHKKKIFSKRIQ